MVYLDLVKIQAMNGSGTVDQYKGFVERCSSLHEHIALMISKFYKQELQNMAAHKEDRMNSTHSAFVKIIKESENMLKSLLENERLRVRALNEQIHQLHKRLQLEQQQQSQTNNEVETRLQLERSQTNETSNKHNELMSDSLDDLTMRSPRHINRHHNQPRFSTQEIQINIEATTSRRKRRSSRREDDEKEHQASQSFNFNLNNNHKNDQVSLFA
jgi:ATP-dependent Clp protease ATP-binding subunit ClpA